MMAGIGKPELLKADLSGWASRRINEEHRLVYRIIDAYDQLEILSCRHHYTDQQQPWQSSDQAPPVRRLSVS